MLISLYKTLQNNPTRSNTLELVFVSLDRKEHEFNDYISDMPWKVIPWTSDNNELRTKLATTYGASGIPHLVLVDGDRKTITSEGTSEVQMDPQGQNFPWKPKGFAQVWPEKVLTKESGLVESSSFDSKHLMLYFRSVSFTICWSILHVCDFLPCFTK